MMDFPPFDAIKAAGEKISDRLNAIREKVGASLSDKSLFGVEIKKRARNHPDEPIIIDGRLSMVYIRDHLGGRYHSKGIDYGRPHTWDDEAIDIIRRNGCYTAGNKVHFYYCTWLQDMSNRGRGHRYHVQPSNQWNKYRVDFENRKDFLIPLPLCQFCLSVMAGKVGSKLGSKEHSKEREQIAWRGDARECMDCVRALHKRAGNARKKVGDFYRRAISSKILPK